MNVIKKVAKAHGVTPDVVKKEISEAIQAGMENPDPKARTMWMQLFPDGKKPTPEKFIMVLSGVVRQSI